MLQCLHNSNKLSVLSLTEILFHEYVNQMDAIFVEVFVIKLNQKNPEYENHPTHVQGGNEVCNDSKLGDTPY
jgi:hypothetical protein